MSGTRVKDEVKDAPSSPIAQKILRVFKKSSEPGTKTKINIPLFYTVWFLSKFFFFLSNA